MKPIFKPKPYNTTKHLTKDFTDVVMNQYGKVIYIEDITGCWKKWEYNNNGNVVKYEDSEGYWYKKECNNNKVTYYENSNGYWEKTKYDQYGTITSFTCHTQ